MGHSPDVLRAFYLIAINKDNITSDNLADRDKSQLVADNAVPLSLEERPLAASVSRTPRWELAEYSIKAKVDSVVGVEFDSLEGNLGEPEAGPSRLKHILKNSAATRKDSACHQCRLWRFQCDRRKPSCWKCQRYFLPCYYEDDVAEEYRQIESSVDPEAEAISWQDSVKDNPYQNLEGDGKLYRVEKRYLKERRRRLAKPIPRERRKRHASADLLKEDQEMLFAILSQTSFEHDPASRTASPAGSEACTAFRATSNPSEVNTPSRTASPTISEVSTPPRTLSPAVFEVNTLSRTTSPNDWVGNELVNPFSWRSSSSSSGYTTSITSGDSKPTQSSLHTSLTIQTTPPTSGDSSVWLPQTTENSLDDMSRPFQCTFCLEQCRSQNSWEFHELSEHIPKKIWKCMPRGPVDKTQDRDVCVFCGLSDPDSGHDTQHTIQQCFNELPTDRTFISKDALRNHLSAVHDQTEMTPQMQKWSRSPKNDDWYWNCGFCDALLPRWSDRVLHIGEHFNEGAVMSSWDPLTPPYPLDKTTVNCAAWFPPLGWDARKLWDLERKRRGFSWAHDVLEEQFRCQHCDVDIYFRSKVDVQRHEYVWHSRREVWSCPTINDIEASILAPYFFPINGHAKLSDDASCPYCKSLFAKIAESYPGLDTWDVRVMHLEFGHNFNSCESVCKSISPGAILLHLANVHRVTLNDMTADVLESCRKDERPLAKKMNMSAVK